MSLFLERINAVPLFSDDFSDEFQSWLSILIDSVNTTLTMIENAFNNGLSAPQYTSAQIATLSATAPDGTIWYATDASPPTLVFKMNGALYKPTVTAFP